VSQDLKKLINAVVDKVNEIGLEKYKAKYSPGENRSLLFVVTSPMGQYGFIMEEDEVKVLEKLKREPTVIVSMNEDTVWAIALGKMDLTYAYATERVKVSGRYALRDYIILRQLFEDLREEV